VDRSCLLRPGGPSGCPEVPAFKALPATYPQLFLAFSINTQSKEYSVINHVAAAADFHKKYIQDKQ
jgi:hypothetical protein